MSQDPPIQHEESESRGRFFARLHDGEAELTYSRAGESQVIADHTYVPEALRGRGLAQKLVEALVADARARGYRIRALCPYVASLFARKAREWDDVIQR